MSRVVGIAGSLREHSFGGRPIGPFAVIRGRGGK